LEVASGSKINAPAESGSPPLRQEKTGQPFKRTPPASKLSSAGAPRVWWFNHTHRRHYVANIQGRRQTLVKKIHRPTTKTWVNMRAAVQDMRNNPTEAEAVLWERLSDRKLSGFRFRRQHPIDRFCVDFCCPKASLVIEVDGPIHKIQAEEDNARQDTLEELGYHVMRFSNAQVLTRPQDVIEEIRRFLESQRKK
jgi:very-short-patch-repair endonuclease